MDEEREEYEPKISLVEILLILPCLLILDILEIVVVVVGLDDFWIGDILATPVTLYLWFKGVSFERYLAAQLLEFLPYIGALPLLSIGFLLVVFLDRNPKLEAAVGTVAAAGGVARGNIGVASGQTKKGGEGTARQRGAPERVPGRSAGFETEALQGGKQEQAPERRPAPSLEQLSAERGTPLKEPLPLSTEEQRKIFEEIPKMNRSGAKPNNGNVIINDNGDVDLRNAA